VGGERPAGGGAGMSLTLVIGGTRSGKSAHAERIARGTGLPVRYVATADAGDPSMAQRIAAHAARRPGEWSTVDAGADLIATLADCDGTCVLLDGLGVWIAGALYREGAFIGTTPEALARARGAVQAAIDALAGSAGGAYAPVIVVAEEAGQGVLPADAGARTWLDLHGEAVQRLSAAADRVELVVAGRALALAGGDLAVPAVLRHHGDRDVRPGDADHAVNVLAGGPPGWLRDALGAALDADATRYPDDAAAAAALAALHGRAPDEVVPTNGAAEALWLLPAALRPRLAACVHPGFTEAEAALRAHGIPVVQVLRDPERGFALDPAAVPDDADLVVVGNPASPDGTLHPAHALAALRRPGRTLVVDEAFMDLVPGEPASLIREPLDDAIVVRSLTKSLAIPGLRAGYAVAAPALAARLRAVRQPWSVNALALAALQAAGARPDALAAAAERAQAEREDLAARLAELRGARTWPAAANFVLVEVPDGLAALAALREQRIVVRPCASFPGLGAGHLRITARAPEQNERVAHALGEAVAASAQPAASPSAGDAARRPEARP
jgi:histidinol-phosphate/aromatic aminotransferase/cobyric acid decarboxylase-like protein/adenosyl cobinamide kinase/adenosyl cobinamide phosphate guanylyltransferase